MSQGRFGVRGHIVLVLVVALMLFAAAPAFAEHTMEHVQQERQSLMDAYLAPGYGNELGQLVVYDPIFDETHLMGLYGLAALCQNYGGYYFVAEDGYYYWHDCAGAQH